LPLENLEAKVKEIEMQIKAIVKSLIQAYIDAIEN